MSKMIDIHYHDRKTAFSHCFAADFNATKHMSQGVAVTFRERFGKPTASDCLSKYIAFRRTKTGAAVNNLKTNPTFYLKPQPSEFNTAFLHLTKDFKRKGSKQLICSTHGMRP